MKGKRTTAQQKMTVALTPLENSIARDDGRVPTEVALIRQQTGLQHVWEAYDHAHALYVDLLEEEAAEAEADGYQLLYQRHDTLVVKLEDLLAKRRGLVTEPVPEITMETLYTGAKVKRKCPYDRAIGIAETVHEYFAREGDKQECKEVQTELLDEAEVQEEALIVKSLVRGGCHVTAAKAEKTPEVGIKVQEGALAADEVIEEQYQAGNMMQVNNKEEKLARLLKVTAEHTEDTLEQIEDVEKARIEFYESLSQLDVLEDEERYGNYKEQELGNLSIRRFKRIAMQRLAGALVDFKARVERPKAEVKEGQRPEAEKQEVKKGLKSKKPLVQTAKKKWPVSKMKHCFNFCGPFKFNFQR